MSSNKEIFTLILHSFKNMFRAYNDLHFNVYQFGDPEAGKSWWMEMFSALGCEDTFIIGQDDSLRSRETNDNDCYHTKGIFLIIIIKV